MYYFINAFSVYNNQVYFNPLYEGQKEFSPSYVYLNKGFAVINCDYIYERYWTRRKCETGWMQFYEQVAGICLFYNCPPNRVKTEITLRQTEKYWIEEYAPHIKVNFLITNQDKIYANRYYVSNKSF